jgi:hypothetical protein
MNPTNAMRQRWRSPASPDLRERGQSGAMARDIRSPTFMAASRS